MKIKMREIFNRCDILFPVNVAVILANYQKLRGRLCKKFNPQVKVFSFWSASVKSR